MVVLRILIFGEFENDSIVLFFVVIVEIVVDVGIIGDGEIVIIAFATSEFDGTKIIAGIDDFGVAFAGTGPRGYFGIGAKVKIDDGVVWTIVAAAIGFKWLGAREGESGKNDGSDESNYGCDETRLPFAENAKEENWDDAETVNGGDKMIGEGFFEAIDIGYADASEQGGHAGENETGVPFVFFHVPADEAGGEGGESDFEPIWIVAE